MTLLEIYISPIDILILFQEVESIFDLCMLYHFFNISFSRVITYPIITSSLHKTSSFSIQVLSCQVPVWFRSISALSLTWKQPVLMFSNHRKSFHHRTQHIFQVLHLTAFRARSQNHRGALTFAIT